MSELAAALRTELDLIEQRKGIVEEALARLVELDGEPPASFEAEPEQEKEEPVRGWVHPTLGKIVISRDHARWDRSWKFEVERILTAIQANPGMTANRLAEVADLSGGQTSAVLRFLEVEGEIEADREADRMVMHRPGKTYHLTSLPEPSKPKPKRKTRRRQGKTRARLLELVQSEPGISTTEAGARLGMGSNYMRKMLTKLEVEGEIRKVTSAPNRPHTWYPNNLTDEAIDQAVEDVSKVYGLDESDRESRVIPGEGIELGRLRGRTL